MKTALFIVGLILIQTYTFSQEVRDLKLKTPENSSERAEILNLFRTEIFKNLSISVVFTVKHLKISGKHAWFEANASSSNGEPIKFPDDSYDCCHVEGLLENVNGI